MMPDLFDLERFKNSRITGIPDLFNFDIREFKFSLHVDKSLQKV